MNIIPFGTDASGGGRRCMGRTTHIRWCGCCRVCTTITTTKFGYFDLGCRPNLFFIFFDIEFRLFPYQSIRIRVVSSVSQIHLTLGVVVMSGGGGRLNRHVTYIILFS